MGFSSVWANWGMVLGCLVYVLFVNKFYRVVGLKLGAMSVPEAYRVLFDNKTRIAIMLMIALAYGIIFATQPVATATILAPMFKANAKLMAWLVGFIFIIMTWTGGLKGLAWMNVVHSFVMYFGMGFAAFIALDHVGGYGQLTVALPVTMFSFVQPDIFTVIAWAVGTALTFFAGGHRSSGDIWG